LFLSSNVEELSLSNDLPLLFVMAVYFEIEKLTL